jgi:TadE-like protein
MSLCRAKGWSRQPNSGESGAAAVEAAIVTPIVIVMLFGIIELGFLFKDYLAASNAVQAGVRIASAAPRNTTFAQSAADSVALSGGAMNLNDVQQLWIYKVAPACPTCALTNKPDGFTDFSNCTTCVQFRWDAPTKKFVTTPNSAHPVLKDNWPASSQNACSTSTQRPDRIGVYIELKHDAFTGLIFKTVTISEASIMSLEPISFVTGCKS